MPSESKKSGSPERAPKPKAVVPAEQDQGDVTLTPEQLAAAREKALRITEELRRKEKLSQQEKDLAEVLPTRPSSSEQSGGAASPNEIEQQRAAVEAAYQEAGEILPKQKATVEAEPQAKPAPPLEPIHEQMPEVEPAPETLVQPEVTPRAETREAGPVLPETLTEFSKEQLAFALKESLDLQEALLAGKRDKVKELLGKFKILFPDQVAVEHRDLLEQKLGVMDVKPEFSIKMYQEENPAKVLEYLGPKRVELLSEDLPYLAMRYEPDSAEKLTVRVRQLIPDLQQVIFTGHGSARYFEPEFVARPSAEERIERLHAAEHAHELLSPQEWREVQKALLTLQTGELHKERELLTDLPQLGSKLRSHAQEFGMMEIVQGQITSSLEPWFEKLPPEQRAAAEKYVMNALELYAGTLGSTQSQK